MSKIRKISIWIMAVTTFLIIAWDIYAYTFHQNATFSVIITDWAFYSPWMPFAWGVLMGHWFAAPMGSKYDHVERV